MSDQKIISGTTEQEVWSVIEADLSAEEIFVYDVLVKQGDQEIGIYIDIDPGGGFESGSEFTMISAKLPVATGFRFAIHHENFIDEIGKFFGMQDVQTGYEEFDKQVIVKTNDEEKVRRLFDDEKVRQVFAKLDDYGLGIHTHHADGSSADQPFLEFNIDEGLIDPEQLREIYHAFYAVLVKIEV